MLACCQGNSHGHLPGSREHGMEQSQFGRREEREEGGVQAFDGPGKALGTCGAAGSPGPKEQSLYVWGTLVPLAACPPLPHQATCSPFLPTCVWPPQPPSLRVPLHSSHTPPSALVGGRLDPSSAPLNRRQRLIPFSGPLDRPLQPRTRIVHRAGKLCEGKTPVALTAPGLQPPGQSPRAPVTQGPSLPASLTQRTDRAREADGSHRHS